MFSLAKSLFLCAAAIGGAAAKEACYFAIGYGAMMKPCCLDTTLKEDDYLKRTNNGRMVGGSVGVTHGGCPADANQAHSIIKREQAEEREGKGEGEAHGEGQGKGGHGPESTLLSAAESAEHFLGDLLMRKNEENSLQGVQELGEGAKEAGGEGEEKRDEETEKGGDKSQCCFEFGYGSLMKPCCLKRVSCEGFGEAAIEQRMGGASARVHGKCPATAEEASEIFDKLRRNEEKVNHNGSEKHDGETDSEKQDDSDHDDDDHHHHHHDDPNGSIVGDNEYTTPNNPPSDRDGDGPSTGTGRSHSDGDATHSGKGGVEEGRTHGNGDGDANAADGNIILQFPDGSRVRWPTQPKTLAETKTKKATKHVREPFSLTFTGALWVAFAVLGAGVLGYRMVRGARSLREGRDALLGDQRGRE